MRAVLCSRNAHKARELERLLPGWTIEPLDARRLPARDRRDVLRERGDRRRAFGREHAAGLGARRGLRARGGALGGRPGVLSARYAPEGAPAIAKLLGELEGVEDRARALRLRARPRSRPTAASYAAPARSRAGSPSEPRGSEGFGYDPIFIPDGEERTVAELGDDWKARALPSGSRARATHASTSCSR